VSSLLTQHVSSVQRRSKTTHGLHLTEVYDLEAKLKVKVYVHVQYSTCSPIFRPLRSERHSSQPSSFRRDLVLQSRSINNAIPACSALHWVQRIGGFHPRVDAYCAISGKSNYSLPHVFLP
jgi:hypothetical protein